MKKYSIIYNQYNQIIEDMDNMHLVCIESSSNKMVMYNFAEGSAEGFPSKLRISASIEWVCSQPIESY